MWARQPHMRPCLREHRPSGARWAGCSVRWKSSTTRCFRCRRRRLEMRPLYPAGLREAPVPSLLGPLAQGARGAGRRADLTRGIPRLRPTRGGALARGTDYAQERRQGGEGVGHFLRVAASPSLSCDIGTQGSAPHAQERGTRTSAYPKRRPDCGAGVLIYSHGKRLHIFSSGCLRVHPPVALPVRCLTTGVPTRTKCPLAASLQCPARTPPSPPPPARAALAAAGYSLFVQAAAPQRGSAGAECQRCSTG